MAKSFNADFYVTCATIIPVLFLAIAVQGRQYESLLRAALASARARRSERGMRRIGPMIKSRVLTWSAFIILVAGMLGELLSLRNLYRGSEQQGDRAEVFLLTLILLCAVVAGPLSAYGNLARELDKLRKTPQEAASGEDEPAKDHHESPPQAGAPDVDVD